MGEQVEDDPFLEILTARRGIAGNSSKNDDFKELANQSKPTSFFHIDVPAFKPNHKYVFFVLLS